MRTIDTPRLTLRELTRDDFEDFYRLRSDPEVMRYIGGKPHTREQVRATLEQNSEWWEHRDFGRWAVIHRADDRLIGWCGLGYLDSTPQIEIGYGLVPAYWRQGLTLEAARAALRDGFERLKFPRIVAVAAPENTGSWRVMEKLGMKYEKRAVYYGSDVVYYAIAREDFTGDEGDAHSDRGQV
ncbi:MAG TPA: GNAT family N-acetyltransferase [Pyrinomonadaceae bacterium]|jgi:ribosomal-protein-alanine N-acetyltransferase|nr:GNAT family N-acetyltransferase [Pyrinomonadaceae bacterium]